MKEILSKYERRIVVAFAEVLIPLDASSEEMKATISRIDDHLLYFTKAIRLMWRVCLMFFELSAFFYYGKCRTMSRMDVELRRRYVGAWHNTWWSAKRTLKRFLETIVFMNYYSLPTVERRIGYNPDLKRTHDARRMTHERLVREFPSHDAVEDVDVCVIGSGAGGAFAAMLLARAGRSVVVLEEGPHFDSGDFGEDVVSMTRKLYRAGGLTNTFGWPAILVPEGRCVGGTTVINSGTCFRTPDDVFRHWVDRYGLATWTPERMRPYYDEVERLLAIAPADEAVQSASGRLFARGASQLGIGLKALVRNAPDCCGSGVCCWGCPTAAKRSVQLNAIPAALEAGAKIYTLCRAERIVFRRHHATDVMARFIDPVSRTRGPRLKVKPKVVIVSCGTLNTPVFLGRSGLPDPSGQRGHNLTLHPASKVVAMFDEDVRGWKGIPQGYYADALMGEGIKLEGIFLAPAFTAAIILLTGKEHCDVMDRYNNLAAFGMMVSDVSRGRVICGPGGHPIAFYNINREDLPKYQRGIKCLTEAFFAAGATRVFPGIHTLPSVSREEGAEAVSRLSLRNKDLDLQAFHPLGTCRMGADPREAVIDPQARIYGLDNVFVADGSIFPTSLGVNPQETIMAAALKIANHIDKEVI